MARPAILIRASEEEMEAWKEAARLSKVSFNAWARNMLNGVTIFEAPEAKIPPKIAPKPTNTACTRRLEKGTFCKGCGRTH